MHPNPTFRSTTIQTSLAFVRQRSFGILTINGALTPLLAHVPMVLNDEATFCDLHLVRSNPIARATAKEPRAATIGISGPDSYISPDWYELDDQVPTWNYVAVHLTGRLEVLPQEDLPVLLERQSKHFETQLAPKPPWTMDKLNETTLEKLMRAIVPMRFRIDDVQSTWKLGQNKSRTARQTAAASVGTHGLGTGLDQLAQWMDTPPE